MFIERRGIEQGLHLLDTGTPPTAYHDILEHIAVIDAAQIAQEKGKRVYLKDVWKDA